MANRCLPQIQACAMRVTRLTSDGSPAVGANNQYVTDNLITLNTSAEIEEGGEILQGNACGKLVVNYKKPDKLKRITISSLTLAVPDPELNELLVGGVVLSSGGARGYGLPHLGEEVSPNGVAIELWSKQIDDSGDLDATFPYAWHLLPRVKLRPTDRNFEDAPQITGFSGFGIENDQWLDGPDGAWPDDSDRAYQWIETATMPAAACGYQTVAAS